jgi:hypothetical protein
MAAPTPPAYRFPPSFVGRWLATSALGRRRHLGADGARLLGEREPAPAVIGAEHVPEDGAFIVVMNHYERPGIRVWWPAMLVSSAVRAQRADEAAVRWLVANRFRRYRLGPVQVPDGLVAWFLGRIARAYELVLVERNEWGEGARSGAFRKATRLLQEGQSIGVTPEAAVGSGRELRTAWRNAGIALAWLSRGETPLLPVAVFEEVEAGSTRLVAHFGAPFVLVWPGLRQARTARDEMGDRVMGELAALLPEELRGAYGVQRG